MLYMRAQFQRQDGLASHARDMYMHAIVNSCRAFRKYRNCICFHIRICDFMTAGGMLTQHYLIRMKFVSFRRTTPQRLDKTFKTCSMCWSRWLLAGEVEWQRRNTPGLDEIDSRIVGLMPTLASMQASPAQVAPCASSSSVPDAQS